MTKPLVWGRRSETARSPARPSLFRRKKELPDTITAAENWSVMETQAQQAPPSNWKTKIALFLTGQTISLFGSCLVQYAIVWYITLTTQSGIMMMISTLCGFLPQVLISLFAGVWADRYHRKRLIICADTLTAVSTLILAILFLAGQGSLWLIFLVSGIRSIGQGIQTPAVQAVIPLLVPQDKLMKVNGINGSVTSMMTLLSPAVSGWLMAVAPLGFIFLIDVITAVIGISILSVQRIPLHQKAREKQKGGYLDDLKAGLRYVKRSGFIRELLIFYAVFFFLLVPAAQMTPLQVTRTFGDDVWRLTLVEMLFSIGLGGGWRYHRRLGRFPQPHRHHRLCLLVLRILHRAAGDPAELLGLSRGDPGDRCVCAFFQFGAHRTAAGAYPVRHAGADIQPAADCGDRRHAAGHGAVRPAGGRDTHRGSTAGDRAAAGASGRRHLHPTRRCAGPGSR